MSQTDIFHTLRNFLYLNQESCLVFQAGNEMKMYVESDIDCWLTRISKIENMCKIKQFPSFTKTRCNQYLTDFTWIKVMNSNKVIMMT